jgi:hypothetical protein
MPFEGGASIPLLCGIRNTWLTVRIVSLQQSSAGCQEPGEMAPPVLTPGGQYSV